MTDDAYPDALPAGHRLQGYLLERVLGQGGFGITYLARDTNLDRHVAIKEYMPGEVAQRRDETVRPRTEPQGERYQWGLERFITEAKTLARFDHPNIVRVYSVFEHNNTAYMVMRFEEGENLAALLERQGALNEEKLVRILLPILDGLERVHHAGFIHRDIKPENIYIRRDGSPVLLDFGSARQSLGRSRTITILVAPGYAPLEQYYGDPESQGPWTDIYSLGATCYRAITGRAPVDAIARTKGVLGSAKEVLAPAAEVGRGRGSERLLAAIDHALKLSEKDRPQSIAAWRDEIVGDIQSPPHQWTSTVVPMPATPVPAPAGKSMPLLWAAGGAAVAALAIGIFLKVESGARNGESRPLEKLGDPPASVAAPVLKQAVTTPSIATAAAPELPTANPALPATSPAPLTNQPAAAPATKAAEQPATESKVTETPARAKAIEAAKTQRADARKTSPVALPRTDAPPPARGAAPAVNGEAPATASLPPAAMPQAGAKPDAPAVVATDQPHTKPESNVALDSAQGAVDQGDYATALRMLKPLAHAGNSRAQLLYANLFASGHGLKQDFNEAYIWYSLAARRGSSEAAAKRSQMAGKLQPVELRQADRIVEAWQSRAAETASRTP